MPIHEYKCRKCEAVVERIEGTHDKPMKKCLSCGGKVDQMISSSAFVLKGSPAGLQPTKVAISQSDPAIPGAVEHFDRHRQPGLRWQSRHWDFDSPPLTRGHFLAVNLNGLQGTVLTQEKNCQINGFSL